MTKIADHPLLLNFSGVDNLEARGLNVSGNSVPSGISDAIKIYNGYAAMAVKEADAETYGERRSEMSFKPQLDPTGERWYSWDFMVPSSWKSDERGFAVMQIHESPGDSVAVQFTLHLENRQLVTRVPVDVTVPGNSSYRSSWTPFEYDRWYSLCLHANWQYNNTGYWEMFIDRNIMFKRFHFPNCYNRALGGYLKLGIYNFNGYSGWGQKTAHYKNVKIYSGNDGYQTILNGAPLSTKRFIY